VPEQLELDFTAAAARPASPPAGPGLVRTLPGRERRKAGGT
jgi:hypothetical protein